MTINRLLLGLGCLYLIYQYLIDQHPVWLFLLVIVYLLSIIVSQLSPRYTLDQVSSFLSEPLSAENSITEIDHQLNAHRDQFENLYGILLFGDHQNQAEADLLWKQIEARINLLSNRRTQILN